MSTTGPSVLLLEDDTADALLIEEALGRTLPTARIILAASRQEYLDALDTPSIDIVLSDGNVSGCEGIEAFHLARERHPGVSFLFLSGGGCGADRRSLHALGIGDLLSKDDLDAVGPAIERALATGLPDEEAGADAARLLAGQGLLLTLAREMALAADPAALTAIVQTAARRLTGADSTSFALREGDDCHYVDETPADAGEGDSSDPPPPARWTGRRLPLGDCLSGWTMQHRQPVVVDDASTDSRVPAAVREACVRSAVVVPVRSGQPVAALGCYWTDRHLADLTEVRLLQLLADSTAVAMEVMNRRRSLQTIAADRSAELSALTYAVSHDLRAPIRHLEGFARILLQDVSDLDPQVRHGAQRIQDAAVHLREMVNGMLTLSRIAQSEVHPQQVDLADLGREVAQSLANAPAPAAGEARAGVVEFVAPPNLPATGDPRLLQSVMQDLLGNAWKFTSRIPRPRVELGVLPTGPATPAEEPEQETASGPVYFVRDNGAGFDQASAERLFGAFQRLHSGEDFPGTGIGLAAVKRIVDKHGGTVRATGTPDEGATIFFTLPDRA